MTRMFSALSLSLVLFGCNEPSSSKEKNCEGAKCDHLSDTDSDVPEACHTSATTGAVRCGPGGIKGLAAMVRSGFNPIAPIACEDISVGDPNDPDNVDEVFENVIPLCEALPHCLFKDSSGACTEAWPWIEEGSPTVQCGLIDSAGISPEAKRTYCAMEVCTGGSCEAPCEVVESAASGAVRCLPAGPAALAEAIQAGDSPVLHKTCSEIHSIANELEPILGRDEARFLMAGICDSVPHCLFKESGEFCMPAWEIVDTASPDVQCRLIDGAAATESAKESFCNLPVEGGCNGADCNRCAWQPAATEGAPGSCTDTTAVP